MTATSSITARDRFLKLLKDDILQLDLAALDFGIYRILNYRRREIDAFLDGELPKQIDAALKQLPGAPSEDEQGRIFHHLYTFFARYYDDGDFVTRPRRGRKAAYSVPYNGQDVHFWWATKGSHYVKSGERFSAYVWRDGARAIRIEVTAANVEKDNVKGAKRYYIPEAIAEADGELRVQLAFRPLDKDEAKRFDKKHKDTNEDADDGEAIEGRGAQERILNHWLEGNGPRKAKIPAGVDKALLKKHVARYVAGQTQDFFVHPQLGEFLTGELDYYLKNEFLEIWDRADGDALARERGKLAVVRSIGHALIAFLAAIEDVQAQLFEKRKFVLASDWLARVSALPEGKAPQTLVAEACANRDQVNEWLGWLGEKPLAKNADAKTIAKRGAELLQAYPHLCLHTCHFDAAFKYRLLALFDDLEAATGGVLIHAENYAALRTLEYAYKQRVKCIYIDPPYNTGKDDFLYADSYAQHATWLSMLLPRLILSGAQLADDGAAFISLDDHEAARLQAALVENLTTPLALAGVLKRRAARKTAFLSGLMTDMCDYVLSVVNERRKTALAPGTVTDSTRPVFNQGNAQAERTIKAGRPARCADETIPKGTYASRSIKFELHDQLVIRHGVVAKDCHVTGPWRVNQGLLDKTVYVTSTKSFRRDLLDEEKTDLKLLNDLIDNESCYNEAGTEALLDRFGRGFIHTASNLRPKPVGLVDYLIRAAEAGDNDTQILDYFAGSGTTGHAVINLNRDDGGTRSFVLVEQGEYFDTVLLPRVAKVIACPEWKDGKPKPGIEMWPASARPSTSSGRTVSVEDSAHWSARSPALVQVLRLERYEDSLDALELPSEADARRAGQMSFAGEPLRYVYEAAAGTASVTLNHAHLAKPFDCTIPQTVNGAPTLANVDLATTALLLLGLHPVRVRDVPRKLGKSAQRYLFIEARPNGKPQELHLLILRDCDDTLTGEPLRRHAEAEMQWLDKSIAEQLGKQPGDYATVWYNRDAVLPSPNGRSLDPEVIRRMLERAPVERNA